jgi:porin
VNAIDSYVGTGVTWIGFARESDEIGFAIAHARVGEPWRRALRAEGIASEHVEVIAELTARLPLGEHVVVQPDVQYLRQPGALTERSSIWAFGLRLELGLAFER